MDSFPEGITRKIVKETLNKLNQHKQNKQVQKLLKQFTDGDKSKLGNDDFINQLVDEKLI
jgi:ribosomal protein L21E